MELNLNWIGTTSVRSSKLHFFNVATPLRDWYCWLSVSLIFFSPTEIFWCFMSCHHWWFSLPTCSQRSGWQVVVPGNIFKWNTTCVQHVAADRLE